MKYVEERALRDQFWSKYGYRRNILAYQFECPARHGNIDLVTVEKVKDDNGYHLEIIGFEFKLNDIEKAFSQAYLNTAFCHKSFVVVPADKKQVILERYSSYFAKYPSIGVIAVSHPEDGGSWDMFHKCKPLPDFSLHFNQAIMKMCMKTL